MLDGWPLTKIQVDMLSKCHIIPVCILELTVTKTEILRRAKKDRVSFDGYLYYCYHLNIVNTATQDLFV